MQRGLATNASYSDIARNISDYGQADLNRTMRIARTEGHRVQNEARLDAMKAAKAKGADVVKQWDATLDGKTRPHHQELDGQIRELDEPFEVAGMKTDGPGLFGDPAEDCNCRCAVLQRARWAVEGESRFQKRNNETGELIETTGYADFKQKYLDAAQVSALPPRFKKYVPDPKRRQEIINEGKTLKKPCFISETENAGKWAEYIQPEEGYYDVVAYGSEYYVEYFGQCIDVETLCAIIAQRDDYTKGMPIRLISCDTGAKEDGVAQYVADKLKVEVKAPTTKALIYPPDRNNVSKVVPETEQNAKDGSWATFGKEKEDEKEDKS